MHTLLYGHECSLCFLKRNHCHNGWPSKTYHGLVKTLMASVDLKRKTCSGWVKTAMHTNYLMRGNMVCGLGIDLQLTLIALGFQLRSNAPALGHIKAIPLQECQLYKYKKNKNHYLTKYRNHWK